MYATILFFATQKVSPAHQKIAIRSNVFSMFLGLTKSWNFFMGGRRDADFAWRRRRKRRLYGSFGARLLGEVLLPTLPSLSLLVAAGVDCLLSRFSSSTLMLTYPKDTNLEYSRHCILTYLRREEEVGWESALGWILTQLSLSPTPNPPRSGNSKTVTCNPVFIHFIKYKTETGQESSAKYEYT